MDVRQFLLETDQEIIELLQQTRRIAVLGIKPETHRMQPAFYVPKYMQEAGCDVIPVPVYYPEVTTILGEEVFRDLRHIPGEIDMVNVFRLPHDIPKHTDEILEAKPRAVWIQSGLRNDEVAEVLSNAGIKVVQDRCLMVEHRALIGSAARPKAL